MEMKTLMATILVLISFAVLVVLIFYFKTHIYGAPLNNITSWGWL